MKTQTKKIVDALIAEKIVLGRERDQAIQILSTGERRLGTGIQDDPALWDRVETIVHRHGYKCEIDDSDGNPYLSVWAIDSQAHKLVESPEPEIPSDYELETLPPMAYRKGR